MAKKIKVVIEECGDRYLASAVGAASGDEDQRPSIEEAIGALVLRHADLLGIELERRVGIENVATIVRKRDDHPRDLLNAPV